MNNKTNELGCIGVIGLFVGVGIMYVSMQWDSQFLLILGIIVGGISQILLIVGHNNAQKKEELNSVVFQKVPEPATPAPIKRQGLSDQEFQKEIQQQFNTLIRKSKRIFWVGDKHRTHPWSLRPGGCTVVVIYEDGECRGYDKVKRPHKYLRKVSEDYISNMKSNYRYKTLEDYINSLYAVREGEVKLRKVWSKGSNTSPWLVLEPYTTA